MPRTISRVLSENVGSSGGNSRIASRISSMSKWFSSGKGDVEATADITVSGHPLSGASVSGPSKARPMLHPISPRLGTLEEDTLSQEDVMPARRREIRFYDEPEPRPAELVIPRPEASQSKFPQAEPSGGKLPESRPLETGPLESEASESESHPHSA
jgi:hypothetical protein